MCELFCYMSTWGQWHISLRVIGPQKNISLTVVGGHQHSRKHIFLRVFYFLDAVIFPWWRNPQENHLWWPTLQIIAIFLAIYPWQCFLECWPPRIISLRCLSWFSWGFLILKDILFCGSGNFLREKVPPLFQRNKLAHKVPWLEHLQQYYLKQTTYLSL